MTLVCSDFAECIVHQSQSYTNFNEFYLPPELQNPDSDNHKKADYWI